MRQLTKATWWLPEVRRSLAVAVVAVILAVVLARALGTAGPGTEAATFDVVVVVLICYFALYTALTVAVFLLASQQEVVRWARAQDRGTWVQRYVSGTAPGPGLSIFVGLTALAVTVLWLPGSLPGVSAFSGSTRAALAVLLVVVAWLTVLISFTIAYLAEDLQSGGEALGFPDEVSDVTRPLSDYLYLAVAVSSTFGTTDVDLHTSQVRRTAIVHGLVAFVFNTVVLAVVVSVIA